VSEQIGVHGPKPRFVMFCNFQQIFSKTAIRTYTNNSGSTSGVRRGCVKTPVEKYLVEQHSTEPSYVKYRSLERTKHFRTQKSILLAQQDFEFSHSLRTLLPFGKCASMAALSRISVASLIVAFDCTNLILFAGYRPFWSEAVRLCQVQ